MAKRIQFRGGTTAQHTVFTGAIREITVDTDKDTLVVHDGSTVGGFPLARESSVSAHTNRTDNPHSVTKTQVGLSNVDNTADANKVVLSASKLTTARTITINGDASGSANFDGSADVTITIAVADDSHAHAFANITSKPTTLAGFGITDADTSAQVTAKIGNAINELVNGAPGTLDALNELANAIGNDPNFASTITASIGNKVAKNVDIVAGTATKVTYDSKGLVTGGTALSSSDIPDLAVSKLTTGTLGVTRGGTGVTTSTGSGSVVLNTAPTLVTPILGVATGTSFNSITGLSSTSPLMNGTATIGTSTTAARADHIHPKDTTKVDKVASTDNAVVRFDGVTGQVQNSGVTIDDNNNVALNSIGNTFTAYQIGGSNKGYIGDGNWLFNGSANDFGIRATNSLIFGTNSTERMRIDSAGNVGIGVTPSAWTTYKVLELGAGNGMYGTNGPGQELHVSNNAYYNSGYKYALSYSASDYKQEAGTHQWRTATLGTAGNPITWTTAMTLDSNGLQINKSHTNYPPIIEAWNDSNNYVYTQARNVSDTNPIFLSLIGGVVKSAILANGNFQSATNSYGSTSDAKLKENVVETSDKLDKLMNVRVVNFNYIGDDQKQIGVIAQEVEKVFPGIVYETKDTEQVEVTKTKEVTDEEGKVTTEEYTETETIETGEVTKNVKYSVIYMMMLKGMQEQQAIIKDLKTRIEILEAK